MGLKEMMGSQDGRARMEQETAFAQVAGLSEQISDCANAASALAAQMNDPKLSEEERERVGTLFVAEVKRGHALSAQRDRVMTQNGLAFGTEASDRK